MDDSQQADICRVCRSEGTAERPLFHPCICTGSIKYIHQECLVQWLRYSRKEYCELCNYRFSFTPIYSPDMPKRLPLRDILSGLVTSVATAVRYWFHYTLVALAWLGVVPLTACRIYRCLFSGSLSALLTLPLDMLSTENLFSDIFHGCFVVMCTLCAFISLVWLREQILHGGGPDWLDQEPDQAAAAGAAAPAAAAPAAPAAGAAQEQQPPAPLPENNNEGGGAQAVLAMAAAAAEAALPLVAAPLAAGAEGGGPGPAPIPDANNAGGGQGAAAAAAADEVNWNPIEWDRAAEELTWERLLGLDGSLVFLEHVFWVVSLNTLFIFIFAFCPHHIGLATISWLQLREPVAASHFEGLLTTLCGYCVIGTGLVLVRSAAALLRLQRSRRLLGLCYVVVKVSLLSVVEIGLFPLVCGWWLDICSLWLFEATLRERQLSFQAAPGTSMFIHWLVGMVYVFYFASFIMLLREVLRPGVLWFLRNLNDPDFNPIQEMIHLPILKHVRRFLASMVIFGSTVLLMLWLPISIIRYLWPSFLPYTIILSSEAQVSELSLELLLLQVILPALLEQGHTRVWLKALVQTWCRVVAWLLDLRSYLLGDIPLEGGAGGGRVAQEGEEEVEEEEDEEGEEFWEDEEGEEEEEEEEEEPVAAAAGPPPPPPPPPALVAPLPEAPLGGAAAAGGGFAGGLGAAHQALLQRDTPTGFQPYQRPTFFGLRILCLLVLMCLSLLVGSLLMLTVPVWVGRQMMALWMSEAKVHELYTAACGLYVCWLVARATQLLAGWLPQGWATICQRMRQWLLLVIGLPAQARLEVERLVHFYKRTPHLLASSAKAVVAFVVLLGLVPLLFGLLLELVVVVPLRVPLHQSPLLLVWQDWALGVLYTKIACACTMMGPNWWLKQAIERAYQDGLRHMDLNFLLMQLGAPLLLALGLALAFPYALANAVFPLFVSSPAALNLISRRIYPFLLLVLLVVGVVAFQVRQFRKLYEHIKNDKYLVGRRLVNYEHRSPPSTPVQASSPPAPQQQPLPQQH